MSYARIPILCQVNSLFRLSLLSIAFGQVLHGGTIVSVSGPLVGGSYDLNNSSQVAIGCDAIGISSLNSNTRCHSSTEQIM
jgi:hypothetical protein